MKKISLLFVIAILAISCSKVKTSNTSANNPVILSNTNNTSSILNKNNQNGLSETNTAVNAEMLKQIENQQRETADPRKAVNKNIENSNQSPKNPKTAGKQTW